MSRFFKCFLILASAGLLMFFKSFAQAKETDYFIPYENVIFKDDFNKDLSGTFPKQWENQANLLKSGWSVKVREALDGNLLSISALTTKTGTISLEPKMNSVDYLTDSFTVDFEFFLENIAAKMDVDFYASTSEEVFKLIFHTVIKKEKNGYILEYERWFNSGHKEQKKLPADFTSNSWHHLAFFYTNNKLVSYLDDNRALTVTGHEHPLSGLLFSIASSAAIRNVRIATAGKKTPEYTADTIKAVPVRTIPVSIATKADNPLNKILTEKKLITHAINFDVNESTIKPESWGFIAELAEFLKSNPTITLEINGHTDSDGDSTANRKLSLARAQAVKSELIDNGIDGSRLIPNGLGATAPLAPNDTPEDKAENRRVEFIKR